jgi:hypothetical protein
MKIKFASLNQLTEETGCHTINLINFFLEFKEHSVLECLIFVQLLTKHPVFYGLQIFARVFRRV